MSLPLGEGAAGGSPVTPLVARASALAAACIAALDVVAWLGRLWPLAGRGDVAAAMAPLSAILVMAMGVALAVRAARPSAAPRAIFLLVALATLAAASSFVAQMTGAPSSVESWLFGLLNHVVPAGRALRPARPLTLLLLALSGCSLLLAASRRGRRIAGFGGLLVAATGLTAALGYAYGAPLEVSPGRLAMSFPGAMATLALGVGVVAQAGPDVLPLRWVAGHSSRALLRRWFMPITVAGVLLVNLLTGLRLASLNPAVASVLSSIFVAACTAVTILLASRTVGRQLDRAQARVRESELHFRDVFEHATIGLYRTTPDGRILLANAALLRMLGYDSLTQLAGRDLESAGFEPGYERRAFRETIEREGEIVGLESSWARADGNRVAVRESARVVRDAAGAILYYEGTVEDITRRRRAEEALGQREADYRTLFDNMQEGLAYCRMEYRDGRPWDFVYESVNASFERLTGLRHVVGRRASDVIPGIRESDPKILEICGRVAAGGPPERFETFVNALRLWCAVSVYSPGPHAFVAVFAVITERKRAEEELRRASTMLRISIASMNDAVFITDAEGRLLEANEAFSTFHRFPAGAARPRTLEAIREHVELYEPDGAVAPLEHRPVSRALRGETASSVEYTLRSLRTGESWVGSYSFAPVRDERGAIVGAVVSGRDITGRRAAEEALRHERYLMQTLMETIPDPIYFKDRASRFLRVNRACAERSGLRDPADAVGKTDFDLFSREHAEAAYRAEQEIIRTGQPVVGLEERESWPDRPSRWVSTTKMPLRDADGTIVGTFGISRDITERKQAQELLQRSEADFRGLAEHAPVGIYRSTRSGRFLTVNPALVRMLGYSWAEEVMRLDLPRDLYADPAERERLIHEGPQHAEAVWKRKDGTPITVELTSHRIPTPEGEEEQYEGVVVDVTQHRNLEAQFRQAQRLEAVGRLAGGVAHDFNNILTAITGYSDLLLEDVPPESEDRTYVEEVKAAALRAATLTRQLLAFSRKQVLQTRVLDLNGVVRTVDKMLRRLIGEDVRLELALAADLGAVKVDPGQVEQVILNLAVNARDAMPAGGQLTIETANVVFDDAYVREHAGATPGPYVMLAVSDSGVGMDDETQSHIFEPFFTTKEQGKGTGLGLATVYGIVKQSGGYVWVYSEPQRGTTFKIYLPRVAEKPELVEAVGPLEPVAGGPETLLVAEDDASVRAIVWEVLTQKGYRVLRAPDGPSALELARAQPRKIDLLVTDLVMPGMTGRELAEALHAERPEMKVLFMSGYTDDAVVRHGVLDSGMAYLQKPFTPRALGAKVREVLDRA